MTKRRARYYLGRVVRGGTLDSQKFMTALQKPTSILKASFSWTITKCKIYGPKDEPEFIFARLAKYEPEGRIDIVDPKKHEELSEQIDNKLIASSPFVYIPRYSGIAYQHIWNAIQQEIFVRRFSEIIESTLDKFFVKAEIDPIVDYRTFVKRLSELEHINKISAKVKPPNPLFGILWRQLKEYLQSRDIEELTISEEGKKDKYLLTKLIELLSLFLEKEDKQVLEKYSEKVDVGDAAVLMAADGYGKAKIEGVKSKHAVIIRTADNMKSFLFDKDPDPKELYEHARSLLDDINKERYMEH